MLELRASNSSHDGHYPHGPKTYTRRLRHTEHPGVPSNPSTPMTQPLWQNIRERKIAEVASRIPQEWQIPSSALPSSTTSNVLSIPRTCGILTPREIHITEAFDANLLLKEIRERKYTSVEVTTAYGKVHSPFSNHTTARADTR